MAKKKSSKPEIKEENKKVNDDGNTENTVSKEEFDKLNDEFQKQKDQFLRMAAEYDNFRKRTEKEKLSTYDNAVAATVEAFLPVVDNFERAMESESTGSDDFVKGLEMIQKQLAEALKKLNVAEFGERGEEFDPLLHNAVLTVEDDELPEDHIVSVYQKGYKIGDKIIRHAMVQVSK